MNDCTLCPEVARYAALARASFTCDDCGTRHGVSPTAHRVVAPLAPPRPLAPLPSSELTPRAPWRPTSPESDLVGLARALPDLSARSPALQRSGGQRSVVTDGRGDRLDARSRELARAVSAWSHARALCLAGHGADVAVLWGAYVVVPQLFDKHGLALPMAQQHRARCLAVALGVASGPLRESWKTAAKVKLTHEVVVGSVARHDEDGVEHVYPTRYLKLTGDVPVPLERAAVVWGREHLADLWLPREVPDAHARGLALGWAPGTERARWEGLGRAVRDLERAAWGERRVREAAAVWRGESESAQAGGKAGA